MANDVLKHHYLAIDEELQAEIVEKCETFWSDLQAGQVPDRLEDCLSGDPRCKKCVYRDTCLGDHALHLKAVYKDSGTIDCSDDDILESVLLEYWEEKELTEEHEEKKDSYKKTISDYMKENEIGRLVCGEFIASLSVVITKASRYAKLLIKRK
jgi:hypothetical protein